MNTEEVEMNRGIWCAVCGCELEENPVEVEVVNPGRKTMVVMRLCDGCWKERKRIQVKVLR